MRKYFIAGIFLLSLPVLMYAQERAIVYGIVLDEKNQPLPACNVRFQNSWAITDPEGQFIISAIQDELLELQFSFTGYEIKDTLVAVSNRQLVIHLKPEVQQIEQVSVTARRINTSRSLKNESVQQEFLSRNMNGVFIKSMDQIPGVNSMDIGANTAKPMIRGMSFNRVAVSENGIKQEGQQWGADHGLEIDPFAVQSAEIVKGPTAIEYGSDAIGGYIHITNDRIPDAEKRNGEIQLLTKSVNQTLAASVYGEGRKNHLFFKLRGTAIDFGDYHLPTDTIVYLTRKIPVVNQYLKNTAGHEFDFSTQAGLVYNRFRTTVSVSQVVQKSGFFPGAHGIPDLERVKDDGNRRDTEYPYQRANHLKIISNSRYFAGQASVSVDLAFQNNKRSEWSRFHTHYPGQSAPEKKPDLELDFGLKTYQVNLKTAYRKWPAHLLSAGIQNQWKINKTGGYNFLLPEYTNQTTGIFLKDDIRLTQKIHLFVAARFDLSKTKTTAFFDPVLYHYLLENGTNFDEAAAYANRSDALDRTFRDASWLAGMVYTPSRQLIGRFNVGKAFRTPTAIELTANGIHHGSFRHEQGNNSLSSEKGYYADVSLEWKNGDSGIEMSPYLYYFSNYIFLNPTGEWSKLPHAGQLYRYTQSKAILSGFELSLYKLFFQKVNVLVNVEYIRNEQVTTTENQRYPLPFTPAPNVFTELEYRFRRTTGRLIDARLFINTKTVLAQNRVSRNEMKTPAYQIMGAGFSAKVKTSANVIEWILQAHNLLDKKYFNHISFYRKMEIPEPGRNIQLFVKIPISL